MSLNIGGIYYGQLVEFKAPVSDKMEQIEGGPGGALVARVVAYQRPAMIALDDLKWGEMTLGERRFTGSGRAD
jgi:hypothetical protein